MLRASLGLAFVLLTTASAIAEPKLELRVGPAQPELKELLTGHIIYLNRCIGGCQIIPGIDDATANPIVSGIPSAPSTLAEYDGFLPGEWEKVVQCVKEIYSPFDVTVTDTKPTAGTYSTILVGGTAANPGAASVGAQPGSGGVALVSSNCSPFVKGVSYAFTDTIGDYAPSIGGPDARPLGLCWIIAQETAHSFGLDHQFSYVDDGRSACNDPMTYRQDCGGQKFYRNKFANCGEFDGTRPCQCGANQNSHLKLVNTFGPGQSIVPAPEVAVTTPAISSTAANSMPANIIASAGSRRGVEKVELYLNGYKWAEAPGAPFGRTGQLNPSSYGLLVPMNQIPDSIYDIEVRAYDDLEIMTKSAVVTVVKGAAGGCTSADACLAGQKCEAGKCFWDEPAGEVGDECTFDQFCKSGLCQGTAEQRICTQSCAVGVVDSCPMGFECIQAGAGGICFFPTEESGCCSTGSNSSPWAPFGLASLVLGFIVLQRRRR